MTPQDQGRIPRARTGSERKGSYGIDAPKLLPFFALILLAQVGVGVATRSAGPLLGAAVVLACGCLGLYASRQGKFVVWNKLLDTIPLKGGERFLDMGCGRGAVLMMAAQRLTTGRAVGVDLWKKSDQSGNAAEATRRNAVAEGVSDRVYLVTGDMTTLPFADESFDVVLSSLAIHNARRGSARDGAITEAVRVLSPGGRLLIADLWSTREYHTRLGELGMADVNRRHLGWRMWWSGPWLATYLVTATKPLKGSIGAGV
jgi:arsenite methyltransferase